MGAMRDEVDEALTDARAVKRDAGAVALLRTYADLIDDAGIPGKYAEALEWLAAIGGDSEDRNSEDRNADRYVRTITLALSRQSAVSDLGPKLLASMEALNLTPRARKAATPADARNGAPSPIDELRDKRRRRAGNVG